MLSREQLGTLCDRILDAAYNNKEPVNPLLIDLACAAALALNSLAHSVEEAVILASTVTEDRSDPKPDPATKDVDNLARNSALWGGQNSNG